MTPNTTEKYLQQNVIDLLVKLGYTFISREESSKLRNDNFSDVVLKGILLEQLRKLNSFEYKGINYSFAAKNISRAVEELNIPLNEGLMIANQKITDKLILGTSYEEELADGRRKSFSLRYIDFDNLQNNVFHIAEEFTVKRQLSNEFEKNRRPDLVLFINGIPFAVIELKKSSINATEGIKQMICNQDISEIPHLFKYIQLTLAGNNFDPRYGTTSTPTKFYSLWEKEDNPTLNYLIPDRQVSQLDKTIYGLFVPKRFLDLLQSFIVFDGKVKKVARYPQYFAIRDVLTRIKNNNPFIDARSGGLIWHTQGSGKSLTMSMLTKAIKREIPNARIIVVTDRIDLDEQIHDTFRKTEIKVARASSGRDLIEKLKSGSPVITTLIHKFEMVKNEVIDNSPDIFVLVDESHRTQGGDLHKAMKKTFPKGCYIGFTGTPLLAKQKKDGTLAKFGGFIHTYTQEQALKDGVILPLLYEGRNADQWVNDQAGLDRKFELITRNLNEAQKKDLQRKWARFSNIASSERRLEMIALDINEHFKQNVQGTGFKAMLATSSKYEAVKYHEIFEGFGEIKSTFVISTPDTREGYSDLDNTNKQYVTRAWSDMMHMHDNEDKYLETVKSQFVKGDELELLIVVDKLLTGFDAPRAQVLYLDKSLKEHNLLQAIARVNRIHDGKDCGFIIDYRGLLEDLGNAITAYSALAGFDAEDLQGTVFDIKEEIGKIKTYHSHLEELFKPVKFKDDQESYQIHLADEKIRREFYNLLSKFGITLKHVLSSDSCENILPEAEINLYKNKMKFFIELKRAVGMRYHEQVDFGKYEKEMQKLLDSYISADEVMPVTKLIDIFAEDFSKEIDNVTNGDNAKADTIISAMAKVIWENHEKNPFFYDKLSEQIKQILEDYKQGRLSDQDKLKLAHDVRTILVKKQTDDKESYPAELLNHGECAKALFDNLSKDITILNQQELITLAVNIDNVFRSAMLKPDWQNNIDVNNQIDQNIDDILYALEKTNNIKFSDTVSDINQLITRVRMIGINNYA